MELLRETQDVIWILACAGLVFLMQAGFCCLESGLVRSKNTLNVATKNFADFCLSSAIFWLFGFALMFGASWEGLVGGGYFFFSSSDPWLTAFFLFQLVFCGTAITITSGAVAERVRFAGYLIMVLVISGLIYPVIGHWAWSGLDLGIKTGWLGQLGFIDFAGSTVVHSVGGWTALAAVMVIGPRMGRFDPAEKTWKPFSLPMATLGVFLLWLGWYGFNGGSTLAWSNKVPDILFNTTFAGISGAVVMVVVSWKRFGQPKLEYILNGTLAGFVAITASCNMVTVFDSLVIGGIGSLVYFTASLWLEKNGIDDVVGAVPVHCGAGIWGTLAVALFADTSYFISGLGRGDQLLVQLTGVGACFVWAFGLGYTIFWLVNRWFPLRVSAREEKIGLDLAEHSMDQVLDMLRQEEYLTGSIVENVGEAIIICDENGSIGTFNLAAEKIFGYSAEEAKGKNVKILMPEPYHSQHDTYLANYHKTGEKKLIGSRRELSGRRKNGELFPLEINITEMLWENKHQFIAVIGDITERKLAEEQIALISKVVEQSPASSFITDSNGTIEYVNPRFTHNTGYTLQEVKGKKPHILDSGEHPPEFFKEFWETILSGKEWRGNICNRKKSGELFWEMLSVTPIRNHEGEITHFVAVQIDDTERKRAEEKLKHYSLELERSNSDLNEFASIASHDLQEPLRKIIMFGDRMKKEYSEVLDDKGVNFLSRMTDAGQRMRNFIEDLLAYSKVSTTPSNNFQATSLAGMIAEVLDDLEVALERSGGRVEVDEMPEVMGDPMQIRRVFQNLIGNALKFRKENESPLVVIKSRSKNERFWEISVQDNGIGFDEAYLDRVFKPFERLHGFGQYPGSGVGLAICHKIVSRHGGKLTAKSKPEHGATFIFSLPKVESEK